MNKNKFNIVFYLIVSLMFIIPINLGYAADSVAPTKTVEQVSNVCSGIPSPNVKDSLILSIVMMCIPGILSKLMEWKEIKCEMAVCSYEAVKENLDPAFCKKQGSYKTCKFIMGEIFAIPPLSILEYLRDLIAGILANPVGTAYAGFVKVARDTVDAQCSVVNGARAGACTAKNIGWQAWLLAANDLLAVYQTFTDMMENGFTLFDDEESKCGQLSEIREDLEGLV